MTDKIYAMLVALSNAAWQLAKAATDAAGSKGVSRAKLIRSIAAVNVAADKLRREVGITCDEIADVEAKLMEEDEDGI